MAADSSFHLWRNALLSRCSETSSLDPGAEALSQYRGCAPTSFL
jgi:hypothetical protein